MILFLAMKNIHKHPLILLQFLQKLKLMIIYLIKEQNNKNRFFLGNLSCSSLRLKFKKRNDIRFMWVFQENRLKF